MVIYYTKLLQPIFSKYMSGTHVTDKEIQKFNKLMEWTTMDTKENFYNLVNI